MKIIIPNIKKGKSERFWVSKEVLQKSPNFGNKDKTIPVFRIESK